MSKTMQEQIREVMAEVEIQPRGNLEAVPEVDTEAMVRRLEGEPETDDAEETTDTIEAEEVETDAEPETEEGEREPVMLSDVAEQLEWTPEDIYSVEIPIGDGETIPIGKAKDAYKEWQSVIESQEQTTTELAEREAALTAAESRLAEQVNMAVPTELIRAEAALQRATDELNGVDWVNLETSNPGQAALMRQKLTTAVQQATNQRDGIAANIEQLRGDLTAQQQQAAQAQQAQAKVELHRLIPSWANEATFGAEREQLVEYGVSNGIDEQIMRMIGDPKIIAYLYKNWQRDKAMEKAKPVTKPPKVLKPQAAQNKLRGRKANVDKLVAKAKTSKDSRDHTAAARALLTGG